MKKIMIYLSILMISNIYAQCDDYSQIQCNYDTSCEWVATYQWYDCDNFSNSSQCNNYSEYGCYWDSHWYYSGWSDCDGPSFQLETGGFCQEMEILECNEEYDFQCADGSCIPIHRVCNNFNDCEDGSDEINCEDCSELLEFNCSDDDSCEWVEDIETGNCGNLWGDDCELNPECNWNCDSVDDYMGWCTYSCDGGPYEIDNSYCEEIEIPECSEMNEFECSSDNSCDWVDNTETGSCSTLPLSVCDLPEYGSCYSDCTNWGNYYNGMFCYGTMYCTGGSYQLDNSYCDDIEYSLGDVNQDNIINIQDVIIIINLILDGDFDLVADINLDSTVNVLDVIQLVSIILN